MKKFCLLMALVLCLALSACSGDADTPANMEGTNLSEETSFEDNQQQETVISESDTTTEAPLEEDQQQEETTMEQASDPLYFESDEVVDKFFADYNSIAEITISSEEIEKGNIRTKALVYIDDLSMEIINADDFLSISMSCSVENEATKLYAIYRDTIWAMRSEVSEDDIQLSWDAIHETGYLVEDYDFNGVSITYVPSKELSWGTSDLRIDLEIPLK